MASTRVKINGRWVDVPDRPNGVRASIRRNNGGFLASEIAIGSIPGGQATVRPGPYMDKKQVERYRWIPQGNGMSLRKHWVVKDVPVARDKNGRPIPMPTNPSSLGGNPIGGFGTPGAAQGRMANGSPIPGALPAYMPYDKRYPGAFWFLLDARWTPSRVQRKAAVGALEGAGGSATLTGEGATGIVVKGAPQSPMAGARDTRGLAWDVVRAGIHERATDNVLDDRWMGDKAPKVDMASEESKRKVLGEFDKAVAAEKDRLAGQFTDNLVKSVEDNVKKTLKPLTPTAAQTAEADTREKVGTGATPEERKGNLDAWNAARQTAHAEEVKRHEESMKYLDDTQKWMKDLAKQHGLKDPTQSAAKGGSAHSLPVSRSEDRFLDDLIGEMEV